MLKHKSIGLNMRLDLATHKRLRLACIERGARFKLVHAINEALEMWLAHEEAKAAAAK